jgi:hypothetical protein
MDEQQNASKSQPRLPPAAACRNLSRQISIEGGAAQQQQQRITTKTANERKTEERYTQ